MPFFRGHSDGSWPLLSGLGRQAPDAFKKQDIESILYYDFLSLGGGLLGRSADSWDVLFAMQHHGLPTRLLDWTTTFASALYFALRPYLALRSFPDIPIAKLRPCVWMLDPFELNRLAKRDPAVANPYTDFEGTYQEAFIEGTKSLGARAVAIIPPQHSPRQSAQRSVFTLHDDLFVPLESFSGECLRKFELPPDSLSDAMSFLTLAGVHEFSIFPDLDGLARHLKSEHVSWM
ncbi:FRG domain-containing protein [Chitinimonas sp.]|uniref:FRG domain-containing protein n=1 Tax=Chitinimonas sp. TaxID=1934313 RepID=UPI002F92135A